MFTRHFDASSSGKENHGPLVGVSRLSHGGATSLVTASRSGVVKVWRGDEQEDATTFNTIDAEVRT